MQPPILADGFAARQEMRAPAHTLDGMEALAADLVGTLASRTYPAQSLRRLRWLMWLGDGDADVALGWKPSVWCFCSLWRNGSRVVQAFRFEKKFV